MKQFSAFEAKTHFSEILNQVMNGEECVITKHGIKVAIIIPFKEQRELLNPVKESIRTLKTLRKEVTLGKNLSIHALRAQGRK